MYNSFEKTRKEAAALLPEIICWRRDLHQIPEVGFDLPRTTEYVKNVLISLGFEPVSCGGGLYADLCGKAAGKTIALRADMDALPIKEESGLAFASENGKMHACGHDSHTAGLLGAAKLLSAHKDELKGRVRFIFQPAEELGTGAAAMIEEGVLDGVDEILGLHGGSLFPADHGGMLFFGMDRTMSCMDRFVIDVNGAGAHGSTPEKAIDPIVAASDIVLALQSIVSREIDPLDSAVVSVCMFNSGSAFNIIPDKVHIEGTVRAFTNEIRLHLKDSIGRIAQDTAAAYRCKVDYQFMLQPPPLNNTTEVAKRALEVARGLYGEDAVVMQRPSMGGEDFANYLEKVPGCFFFLNNPMEIEGKVYPHHTSRFALDESFLDRGAAVMAAYVIDSLK